MKLEEMSLNDVFRLVSALKESGSRGDDGFFEIGKAYFIRTVTMHHIGLVKKISDKGLILGDASWVADSGRFNNALKTGELSEVEPFVDPIFVSFGAIIDATLWKHAVPTEVK